jgi:pimeloyl-ACP methyl ester carboxylesterase
LSAKPNAERVAPPLAHLNGARPPAPDWFERALSRTPERTRHEVRGAQIEALSWGEVGRPGLLLLHGNGAHADWYGFIAPLLARDFRVVALSWSGMGGSDWRSAYSLDLYVAEAFAVAEATGLFASHAKPVFAGHSFGSFPTLACAARAGERLGGIVAIDMPLHTPEELKARAARRRDDGARRERFAGALSLRPAAGLREPLHRRPHRAHLAQARD